MVNEPDMDILDWGERAKCKNVKDVDFYPPLDEGHKWQWDRPAKRLCAECPVKGECLQWALDHGEQGVWGGTTTSERWQILSGRKDRPGQPKQSHCQYGHPFDAENTYIRPNGARLCKTCQKERRDAFRARTGR